MSPRWPARPEWQQLPLGDHLLAESPRWDAEGETLWWVDILGGSVCCAPRRGASWGEVTRYAVGRMPTAVQPLPGGEVAVAVDGAVVRLGPRGQVRAIGTVSADLPAVRTNDMTVDPDGRLLVGLFSEDRRSPRGGVVRVDPGGEEMQLLFGGYVTTNGLAIDAVGEHVYAVDTARGTLTRHPLEPGAPAPAPVVVHEGPGVLDGIAVGPDGDVWVAVWDAGAVHRYTGDGRLRAVLTVPVPRPSAVAVATWGGIPMLVVTTARRGPSQGRTLPPDSEGRLYAAPMPD